MDRPESVLGARGLFDLLVALTLASCSAELPTASLATALGETVVSGEAIMQLADGTLVHLSQQDVAPIITDVLMEPTSVASDVERVTLQRADRESRARLNVAEHARRYPSGRVPLTVTFSDASFSWRAFSDSLSDAETVALIAQRRLALRGHSQPLLSRLEALGATEVQEYWISPTIAFHLPAAGVDEFLSWVDSDAHVELAIPQEMRPLGPYSGVEGRSAMLTTAFVSAGYTGSGGNRVSPAANIRAGIMEYADPNGDGTWSIRLSKSHPGFQWPPGTGTRWGSVYKCIAGNCTIGTSAVVEADSHGTSSTRILAGSIENGQDSNITGSTARIQRSGLASGVSLYYYAVDGCSSALSAIQTAVAQHVDLMNVSLELAVPPSGRCDRSFDCAGLNQGIANATDAGLLFVFATGNSGSSVPSDPCSAAYPAVRKDGLAVGAIQNDTASATYDTAPLWQSSSRGGMTTGRNGTATPGTFAVVDLVAPSNWIYRYDTYFVGSTQVFTYADNPAPIPTHGTSSAAPAVAGAAAQLRHAFKALGWNLPSARELLVNMLLMGNGFASDLGTDLQTGMDRRSGAGRVKMHFPTSGNLTPPTGWGWHTVTLGNNQQACWNVGTSAAESTAVTQWKAAMTWDEIDYDAVAQVVIKVSNVCPPGGGPSVTMAQDFSTDIRKRLELSQSAIGGKCLRYCVTTSRVPSGQTRTIHVADYYHSGDPAAH